MISFSQFISESSKARQGLPHVHLMDHGQFSNLIKTGKVHISGTTEKSDGYPHQMGYDEKGFYTQSTSSGSEKMRTAQDYVDRATRRSKETGKPLNLSPAHTFGHIHKILQSNTPLVQHLSDKFKKSGSEVKVRGEVLWKPLSGPGDLSHERKFVMTSYDPSHMGTHGKYIIHTKLPENQKHDAEHFKNNLSTHEMNFDDDKVHHADIHIDVSKEKSAFDKLDHNLIKSRTTNTNRNSKLAELGKMEAIKLKVHSKVDQHINKMNISPKWGSGTEGLVVHPSSHNPEAPRFKVTSTNYRDSKASGNKPHFKNND